MQVPIPDDWDGNTWNCYFVTFPHSVQWDAILRGLLSIPVRGRFWDGRTGSILDVQETAKEIIRRNAEMDCNDLITVLQEIRDNIDNVTVEQNLLVNVTSQMATNIQVSAQATAQAYAWSQAFALSTSAVKVINNVELVMRPLEPGVIEAPQAEETEPTGITPTAHSMVDTEICRRVWWYVYTVKTIFNHWWDASLFVQTSILGFLGMIATGLSVAALKGNPAQKAILIPAAVLLQAAHYLTELYYEGLIQTAFGDINTWLNDNWTTLVCEVYALVVAGTNTLAIQQAIIANYLAYSIEADKSKFAPILLLFTNLNTLAALYYVSSLIGTLPDVPAEFGGNEGACVCE